MCLVPKNMTVRYFALYDKARNLSLYQFLVAPIVILRTIAFDFLFVFSS